MNSLVLHSSMVLYYVFAWKGLMPLILQPSKHFPEDVRLTMMRAIGSRYLTIWNFTFHTAIFVGYLICDILELKQEPADFRRKFKKFLDEFFYSIIVPCSILVAILFWAIYLYDPGLVYIYPNLIVDTLTPWANHTMHTIILPIAFLQVYHNKASPLNLIAAQKRLIILALTYLACLYGTYLEKNVWVYPFLDYLFEPLRLAVLVMMGVLLLAINVLFHRVNEFYCAKWATGGGGGGSEGQRQRQRAE